MVVVVDVNDGTTIFSKNSNQVAPIASITKLMTAVITLDAALPMDELITIDKADLEPIIKRSKSRLKVGTTMTRNDLLWVAIMSSENRAAHALSRTYPTGKNDFILAMNTKAAELGMANTKFVDPTGLFKENVSTAEDLTKLVIAASSYPLIHEFTVTKNHKFETNRGKMLPYHNTNVLVHTWNIFVSKTGYIKESGRCVVMRAQVATRDLIFILLKSTSSATRKNDANMLKKWIEHDYPVKISKIFEVNLED